MNRDHEMNGRLDEGAANDGSARSEPLIHLQDVGVRYRVRRSLLSSEKIDINAVDGVTLLVEPGHTLGLVGATGAGKSTLAHLMMGMVKPSTGSVMVGGYDLSRVKGRERRDVERQRQVVLQDPYSSLNPRMKVGDIIAEPLTLGRHLWRGSAKAKIDERVSELLQFVGLSPEKADLFPYQFSGGQRQRISIARALAPEPKIIILDEPTSALDVSVRAQILNLLRRLQDELGVTYLIVSHDLLTVAYLASTVAVMHRGRIVEIGPTQSLYSSPRHPCTLELLASVPGSGYDGGSLLNQPRPRAESTGASLPPTACHFASGCALRTHLGYPTHCIEEDPGLRQVGPRHESACHFPDKIESLKELGANNAAPVVS